MRGFLIEAVGRSCGSVDRDVLQPLRAARISRKALPRLPVNEQHGSAGRAKQNARLQLWEEAHNAVQYRDRMNLFARFSVGLSCCVSKQWVVYEKRFISSGSAPGCVFSCGRGRRFWRDVVSGASCAVCGRSRFDRLPDAAAGERGSVEWRIAGDVLDCTTGTDATARGPVE